MKNFLHKSLSFVLVITLVLSLFSGLSFQSGALSSSGHCGYQVTYTFNSSSGLLIISGSGYIGEDEVGTPYDTPFKGDDSIKTVVINSGVKRVGDEAFMCCSGLENITIPDSVISIGYNAFYNSGLYTSQSNWENGVLYIDNHLIRAEADVSASYQIKPNTKTIASDAFYYCNELTNKIYIYYQQIQSSANVSSSILHHSLFIIH